MREIDYSGTSDLALSAQNQISSTAAVKSRQMKHFQRQRAQEEKCDWALRKKSLFHPTEACILNSRQTERRSLLGVSYTQPWEERRGADHAAEGIYVTLSIDVPGTTQWKIDKIWSSKLCHSLSQTGVKWLCIGHMWVFGPQPPDWTAVWFSWHSR